jgi:hypothetical protein
MRTVQVVCGIFYFMATGIFIGEAFTPGKGGVGLTVFAAMSAAAAVWMLARCFIAPTIIATPDGILVRELLRTRKYHWTEIEQFQVSQKPVGSVGYNRRVLGITFKNGETIWFKAFNDNPKGFGWVDGAAYELNLCVSGRLTLGC